MLAEIGRWALFVVIAFVALTGFMYLIRGTVVRAGGAPLVAFSRSGDHDMSWSARGCAW
jgi:hypothetical protein